MLMDMKARTEAQRALAYYTAGQMDRATARRRRPSVAWPSRRWIC